LGFRYGRGTAGCSQARGRGSALHRAVGGVTEEFFTHPISTRHGFAIDEIYYPHRWHEQRDPCERADA
jgi:hypothetical protein